MRRRLVLLFRLWATVVFLVSPAFSATLLNDPKGFHNISWGSPLHDRSDMVLVESGERIKGYAIKDDPLQLGEARVESVKFFTIDGKFVRVVVRYRGEKPRRRFCHTSRLNSDRPIGGRGPWSGVSLKSSPG